MSLRFHPVDEDSNGEDNLFSKVLNGMKTVFNAENSKKAVICKTGLPVGLEEPPRPAEDCAMDVNAVNVQLQDQQAYKISNDAILIPILNNTIAVDGSAYSDGGIVHVETPMENVYPKEYDTMALQGCATSDYAILSIKSDDRLLNDGNVIFQVGPAPTLQLAPTPGIQFGHPSALQLASVPGLHMAHRPTIQLGHPSNVHGVQLAPTVAFKIAGSPLDAVQAYQSSIVSSSDLQIDQSVSYQMINTLSNVPGVMLSSEIQPSLAVEKNVELNRAQFETKYSGESVAQYQGAARFECDPVAERPPAQRTVVATKSDAANDSMDGKDLVGRPKKERDTVKKEENKGSVQPRIVIKFRSEKPGLRSDAVKIVSESGRRGSDRSRRSSRRKSPSGSGDRRKESGKKPGEADPKRNPADSKPHQTGKTENRHQSHRHKSSSSVTADSSSAHKSKHSSKHSSGKPKERADSHGHSSKSSSRDKSSDPSGHTRLSRRIKPTAKVLANREMRIGLETQNNVRMGKSSPEKGSNGDEGKLTRSKLRKSHDAAKVLEPDKTDDKSKKTVKRESVDKKPSPSVPEKTDTKKSGAHQLTPQEIKQCILGTSYVALGKLDIAKPKPVQEKVKDAERDEDEERRRLNRLKKKHLFKLGLRAVSSDTKKQTKERENLTDDSTMDSTNTEAIIEHLNNRNKILQTGPAIETSVIVSGPSMSSIKPSKPKEKPQPHKSTHSHKHHRPLKKKLSDSENEDPNEKTKSDNGDGASPRVTRKRSRIENGTAENPNDPDKDYVPENEPPPNPMSCYCKSQFNLHAEPNSLVGNKFCGAMEFVGNRNIGCGRLIASDRLVRAGARAPFFLACEIHHYRLSQHQCCAGCGVFCSQGTFYQCNKGHLFHWECSLPFVPLLVQLNPADQDLSSDDDDYLPDHPKGTVTDRYNSEPGCPHCGVDPKTSEAINQDCTKVVLEMKSSAPMVLLPTPRMQWLPALMSFSSRNKGRPNRRNSKNLEITVLPKDVLSKIRRGLKKLTDKRDRHETANSKGDNQKDVALIKAVCDKENTVENIISAINSGSDPKKRIACVNKGTFLHLAARELNIAALHIFKILGCDLDALDVENRTPLMLAVMNFETEFLDENKEENGGDATNVKNSPNEPQKGTSGGNKSKGQDSSENKSGSVDKELVGQQREYRMVVDYLLKAGGNVSLKGPNGATVLHLAAKYGDVVTCSAILNNFSHVVKSIIDIKDDGEWTPLVWAVENKRVAVVQFLLENGADPMSKDSENNTPLHWAAMTGCGKVLEDLLNYGSQINVINSTGNTPLHLCARENHYNCLIILLARGAQIDLKNFDNETPIQCISDDTSDCYSALAVNEHLQKVIGSVCRSEKILSLDISYGKEAYPIQCVNSVDNVSIDDDYVYVMRNCQSTDINIDYKINSMQSCQCTNNCGPADSGCACANMSMQCWYDSDGRLIDNFDYRDPPMIFECNDYCKCNKLKCLNHVIDKSPRVLLRVFRQTESTARGTGWGVQAVQPIAKGTFVVEFIGEVLSGAVAYNRDNDCYLFELSMKGDLFEDPVEVFCIDSKNYGNVSRFINHKCEPNLTPVRVFVNHQDLRFPRIALFARRDIKAGEELGFDYGPKFWSVKIKKFNCHCNSTVCRYNKRPGTVPSEGTQADENSQRPVPASDCNAPPKNKSK